MTKILLSQSPPTPLQLLASGDEGDEIHQPDCCATLFTREPNFRINTRMEERTCVKAARRLPLIQGKRGQVKAVKGR